MTKIKICGITNLEDALRASELGVDAVGFVFAESPRRIAVEVASQIIERLPPFLVIVGIFSNESMGKVKKILTRCNLSALQFHGDESPSFCKQFKGRKVIKALRMMNKNSLKNLERYEVDAYLLDTYVKGKQGGTGQAFDWNLALFAKQYGRPLILSGGLSMENVAEAIKLVHPYAVDVSSGVESYPGKKDYKLMEAFIRKVRSVK